jgi:CheY-like chemotaxis protein
MNDDARATPAMPALTGVHVLIVDGDAAAREMATVALEHCGPEVASAASAEEARQVLANTTCDVLLIDIAMPDEDGYTLMREMRASGIRQPAAALTAQAREADRVEALLAGFDVHILQTRRGTCVGAGRRDVDRESARGGSLDASESFKHDSLVSMEDSRAARRRSSIPFAERWGFR